MVYSAVIVVTRPLSRDQGFLIALRNTAGTIACYASNRETLWLSGLLRHSVKRSPAFTPVPHVHNQQAIRVIREEVERIDGAAAEIMSR